MSSELYRSQQYPEAMHLLRLAAGTTRPSVGLTGGEELFVLTALYVKKNHLEIDAR